MWHKLQALEPGAWSAVRSALAVMRDSVFHVLRFTFYMPFHGFGFGSWTEAHHTRHKAARSTSRSPGRPGRVTPQPPAPAVGQRHPTDKGDFDFGLRPISTIDYRLFAICGFYFHFQLTKLAAHRPRPRTARFPFYKHTAVSC
jgi:hypothetical protein